MLKDPTFVKADEDLWIGRGSFGVVKIQLYRGIKVVCKELRVKTLLQDVYSEASILTRLSHPYLPYLFGVCTTAEPYRLVMQFHGIGTYSCTFSSMMQQDNSLGGKAWLSLCGQVFEAFRYLHDEAGVLHNDIKANNLLIAESISTEPDEDLGIDKARVQAVVIDFGMASNIQDKKRLRLSGNEIGENTHTLLQKLMKEITILAFSVIFFPLVAYFTNALTMPVLMIYQMLRPLLLFLPVIVIMWSSKKGQEHFQC